MSAPYIAELEAIRANAGGLLRPEDVLAFASDPDSALHRRFNWDDTEAAHQHRLWQARQLIRAVVTILPNQRNEAVSVRAYVNLPAERGYHAVVDLIDDEAAFDRALEGLRADVDRLRAKYAAFAGLRPMLDDIAETVAKAPRRQRKRVETAEARA